MTEDETQKGRLFTHAYLDRSQPIQDSLQFRKRIGYLFESKWNRHRQELAEFLKLEMGLDVPYYDPSEPSIELFFEEIEVEYLLNAITLVWRFLKAKNDKASFWMNQIARALKEENLCYRLDEECGVHYLVDREFETNFHSALTCLGDPRYAGVRKSFTHAYDELTSTPPHTKDAVRAIFESIEILVKQMVETKNLNKRIVQGDLKDIISDTYSNDPTAKNSAEKFISGFGEWVDAIHNYRHGQDHPEPTDPPLKLAIYIFSSGASFLRWLVEIDMARNSKINQ